MRCWNCGRTVAKKEKVCEHCEADLAETPSPEKAAAVIEICSEQPLNRVA